MSSIRSADIRLAGAPVYSPLQQGVHWLQALLIFATLPLGVIIGKAAPGQFSDATMDGLYNTHRSLGFLVLAVAVLRVLVRVSKGAPPPVPTLTPFERIASTAVHHLLYLMIFVVPLLGWAGTSAYRAEISVFGLFNLPHFVAENRALSETLLGAHGAAAMLLALLVAAHIGGALMHLVVKRDGVFRRMWPGG